MPQAQSVLFSTAGVVVRVDGLGRGDAETVRDVGCGMLVDTAGAPDVRLDARELHVARTPSAAAVLAAVDRAARSATRCLVVHAAVLVGPRGAVVVPGVSGAGKSTLAAAGQRAGLRLATDEAACFRPDGRVVRHARPLGLSADSRRLVGLPAAGPDELAVSPALLGSWLGPQESAAVALVAVPRRGSDGDVVVRPTGRSRALNELLQQVLVPDDGPGAWSAASAWSLLAGAVAGAAAVVELAYSDVQDAARTLAGLLSD